MQDFSACLRKLTYFVLIWIKAHSHTTLKIFFRQSELFFWWAKNVIFCASKKCYTNQRTSSRTATSAKVASGWFFLLFFLFTFFRHFFWVKRYLEHLSTCSISRNQDEVTQRSIFSVRWNLPLFLQFTKRYVFWPLFLSIFRHQKSSLRIRLMSKCYPNAQLKHLRKNAFQYYKLWVNDTKNDKVPKINVTTEDINDNLDELGYHGTIGITSKHLLLRNFLRSKGVRVLEARFGSFVPTKLRTEIPTTIRQGTTTT